jgi:hypothetical protein
MRDWQDWLTYRLSDFLLFSPRTYYRMFELYHDAVWPLHLVVLAIVVVTFVLLRRTDHWAGAVVAALIAVGWLWVGVAFHLQRYATINWAAKYFAGAFVLQAVLVVWFGIVRRRLTFAGQTDEIGRLVPAAFVAALVIPPLAVLAQDRGWAQVDLAWLTPDATAITTLALLLGARPSAPKVLLVVPLAWCVVAAATLTALESPEAWVPVAALIVSVLTMHRLAQQKESVATTPSAEAD